MVSGDVSDQLRLRRHQQRLGSPPTLGDLPVAPSPGACGRNQHDFDGGILPEAAVRPAEGNRSVAVVAQLENHRSCQLSSVVLNRGCRRKRPWVITSPSVPEEAAAADPSFSLGGCLAPVESGGARSRRQRSGVDVKCDLAAASWPTVSSRQREWFIAKFSQQAGQRGPASDRGCGACRRITC